MNMKIASPAMAVAALVAASRQSHAAGFGTFFAAVNAAGAVSSSSGVSASTKTAVGRYEITFNRDIDGCAMTVTVAGANPRYATVRKKASTTQVIQVYTFSNTGAPIDAPFQAVVVCNS